MKGGKKDRQKRLNLCFKNHNYHLHAPPSSYVTYHGFGCVGLISSSKCIKITVDHSAF